MKNITITVGDKVIRAQLNDTVAARDFEKRLPFTCSGQDSGIDYCATAADGQFDPGEIQAGWQNGDISLGGGWFALLYGGEETSKSYEHMMIIGHIDEQDMPIVHSFPASIQMTVDRAE